MVGRLPVITTLDDLDEPALVRILTEPKNALVKQYQKLFGYDHMELEITPEALTEIAAKAIQRKTGARGLRSIMEGILVQTMYDVPSLEQAKKVVVTKECVTEGKQPEILGCRWQANCCAGRICKVKPKQIKTETGSSCKNSQELPAFDCCMVV